MASKCTEGVTSIDFMHALAYAQQQVNKMKCEDPEIVKKVCDSSASGTYAGGGTCIQWEQDESQAVFPKPESYYNKECTTNEDCYLGKCKDGVCQCETEKDCSGNLSCLVDPENPSHSVCAYAPENVAAGHCIFNNPIACKAQGQLPYTCDCGPQGNDDGSCQNRPQKDLNKPYTEWHVDDEGKGKCVLGNFVLRQWCEQPCTRCAKNKETGKYPSSCSGGEDTPGVTTVPPFFYDQNKGACYMTHDYCDAYGLDYNMSSCQSNDDCPGKNNYCAPDGHCSGPDAKCYTSTGDKVAQFFIGKTLFYLFKNKLQCKTKESYQPLEKTDKESLEKEIAEQFNSTPEIACYLHDEEKIKRSKVIKKDFGGDGIHLYIYEKENKIVTGFDPKEVKKVYPENVQKSIDGKMMICVDRNELKGDKYLKRIYLTINSSSWITQSMISLIKMMEK